MKLFESPELLVSAFEIEDIIATSNPTDPTDETDPIDPTTGDTGTDIL